MRVRNIVHMLFGIVLLAVFATSATSAAMVDSRRTA